MKRVITLFSQQMIVALIAWIKNLALNKIIGPKLGVNDVLLGTFNDFPLSNLLINFPISSWLISL